MSQSKNILLDEYEGEGFYLAQFKAPSLAIFSYYIESKKQVLLIDPTFDISEYKTHAAKRGDKIISILLTHYHSDYVAGHA